MRLRVADGGSETQHRSRHSLSLGAATISAPIPATNASPTGHNQPRPQWTLMPAQERKRVSTRAPVAHLLVANLATRIVDDRRCLRRHKPPALLSRARSSRSRAGANSVPASTS